MARDEQSALGARLREARVVLHLSQEDVAAQVGIARSSLSDVERGRRRVTTVELQSLARIYQRSVEWLLGDGPAPPADPELLRAVAELGATERRMVLEFAWFLASRRAERGSS